MTSEAGAAVKNTTTNGTRWVARVLDSGRGDRARRRRDRATCLLLALGCTAGCACSGVEPESSPTAPAAAVSDPVDPQREAKSPMNTSSIPRPILDTALDDAATRASVDRASIRVVSAGAVTWSDGSAGCPEPGMMYTQALVPGYRIVLQAGEQLLNYHAARSGVAKYCPAERVIPPSGADQQAI